MKMIAKTTQLLMAGALGIAATLSYADPTVIDFENEAQALPGTVDGFVFTVNTGNANINSYSDVIETGTTKLFAWNGAGITMTMADGGAFSLLSLDVGGSYISDSSTWADFVTITAGAASWIADLTDNVASYHNQVLSSDFWNVTSVTFTPTGGGLGFTLDNINVGAAVAAAPNPASVPEPGTFGVLAACLIGLGLMRRRTTA